MGDPPFTVLLPVYRGDQADFVRQAYRSVTTAQTLPPDNVLIVRDGPVSDDIEAALCDFETDATTTVLRLPENVGLASALNAGLAQVRTPIVARADADDVCLPHRFATQLPIVAGGVDVVGSSIAEFSSDPSQPERVRRAESDPTRLRQSAQFECPFFHPTVMFKVDAVQAAGGYRHLALLEDYLLWATMIAGGATVANCAEVLVHYRVGAGAYDRRGGFGIARSEFALQRQLRRLGLTTRIQFARNVVLRCGYRLAPTQARQWLYWRRRRGDGAPLT